VVASVRNRILEGLLLISSILVACLGVEAAFSTVGLRYVPLRLHGDLPADIRIFAQSSKAGVVPEDFVLLLGDSYAHGYGDWLLAADPDRNGPFHSAHVINQLIGRDVVTLGVSGAGSVEGMVAFPANAYAHAKRAWYLRLPPPHAVVVYFYEGNDLNDNARFLASRVAHPDAPHLAEQIDRSIAAYSPTLFAGTDWRRQFPFFRFLDGVVRRSLAEFSSARPITRPELYEISNAAEPGQVNIVEVAGQAIALPGNLQSPAMELSHPELERTALVFERSLVSLRRLLPGTPVLVVYLPSPLSSYRLLAPEVSIQRYVPDRTVRTPKERVAEYSNAICLLIRTAAVGQGAGFLDSRPAVRAASAHDILHGPRDFKHFNRKGMEVLGRTVAQRLNHPQQQESCGS
jgi:hypothetical protein